MRPIGTVARADLLRALADAPRDSLTLDESANGWFGYRRRLELALPDGELSRGAPVVHVGAGSCALKLPLRMLAAWAPVRQSTERHSPELEPAPDGDSGPLTSGDLEPESPVRQIGYEDLVPEARLLPILRRRLGSERPGSLDPARTVTALAMGRLPRRLPRHRLSRWHPEIVVVLDFCDRLWPYRADMHKLVRLLLRHRGDAGLSVRIVNHGPLGPWSAWSENQSTRPARRLPRERAWRMPVIGTPVLLVSDLGRLLGVGSAEAVAWDRFIECLRGGQACPLALAPLGAQQLDAKLARALPVLRWSPDAPGYPVRGQIAPEAVPETSMGCLKDLLAMIAAARRVDPPLLRVMRRLVPGGSGNAGLEGAAWVHPDVESGFAAAIKTERQAEHLARFKERLPTLHATLDFERRKHHAHLPTALTHEETLLWSGYANEKVLQDRRVADRLKEARQFLARLAETLALPAGAERPGGNWIAVAQGIVRRAEGTSLAANHRVLYRLAARLRAVRGDDSVPDWADPAALRRELADDVPARDAWLVQCALRGALRLQAEPAGPRQSGVGKALSIDGGGFRVTVDGAARWISNYALPADLCGLQDGRRVLIETTTDALEAAAIRRPRGATGWASRRAGIEVAAPMLGRATQTWSSGELLAHHSAGDDLPHLSLQGLRGPGQEVSDLSPAPEQGIVPLMTHFMRVIGLVGGGAKIAYGLDKYGVFADLAVFAKDAKTTQRLRRIEPGIFLMGSTVNEAGRFDGEGPRHQVSLTRGFWLADTPCTQALWQSVMGKNPSSFKGADRPVEQVSWGDVQEFLRRLQVLEHFRF